MGSVTTKLTIPGLDDDQNAVLNENLERLIERRRRNYRRSCMYDGRRALEQMRQSTVVPPHYYHLGIALGWCGKAIDGLTRRTQLQEFVWDSDLSSIGMDEFSRDNFLVSEITQGLTDSALHGISFLINTQGDVEDGEPKSLIHVKDALNATGTWNHRRRALDNALSITRWDDNDDTRPAGLVLYLPDLTISADLVDGKWQIDPSEHLWGVPVEPLVYKPRPSRRYGSSRLTHPIMGLQMQAVRELIRLEGHMDIYSYPELFMLGADMSAFKNADGTQKAIWQVMLGRIKGIEDNPDKPDTLARADVKQFPASSPGPHIDALDMLSRAFAREASLPDSAVALKGVSNPISADSYDASQYELIAEAEGAMRDWNTPIQRAVARGLAIQNGYDSIPSEWWTITPKWLGAKFESRAAKADAGVKQLAAIPWLADTEIGLELIGLEPDQIQRALAERRRNAGRNVITALAAAQQPVSQVRNGAVAS